MGPLVTWNFAIFEGLIMNFLKRLCRRRFVAHTAPIVNLVREKKLTSVYQPVVFLNNGTIVGHEALVRSPKSLSNFDPLALLGAAKEARFQAEFELACVEHAMACWDREFHQGRLFINISAESLLNLEANVETGRVLEAMIKHRIPARRLVFELTEHSKFEQLDELLEVVKKFKKGGVEIALDDLKGSESSLILWRKLAPGIVKMDNRYASGVAGNEDKSKAVRSMVEMARRLDSALIAKGVENAEDLRVLRDLGVGFAQGRFLGSPDAMPVEVLNQRAKSALMS